MRKSAFVCGLLVFAATPAFAWNAPDGARGDLFIYVAGREADLPHLPPELMDGAVAVQTEYLAELASRSLPLSQVHVLRQGDIENGRLADEFTYVDGLSGPNDPVDFITLTHSDGDTMTLADDRDIAITDVLKLIPNGFRNRLRLYMNAGCSGAYSASYALDTGFRVALGAKDKDLGPLVLVEFLKAYLQGATAAAAAAHINDTCKSSLLWNLVSLAMLHKPAYSSCQDAEVIAIGKNPADTAITIESVAGE